ncbi:MAG: ATP-binding cassette domain-containing protein [Dermatophilaceae bacterium]
MLGSNGSGKSRFLRLLAAGGVIRTSSTGRSGTSRRRPWRTAGSRGLGSRVRPGWFAQTHDHTSLHGPLADRDLSIAATTASAGKARRAAKALDRYGLAMAGERTFKEMLSGGQQARFQILLLELSAPVMLLDEPTEDNPRPTSAEALEEALERAEGDGGRGHARPVVRAAVRPVPRLRRGQPGLRSSNFGVGRDPRSAPALSRVHRSGIHRDGSRHS